MKLEQHENGQREDEAGEGEDVDEPAPRGARVAALMKVVEIGNPAAVGDLARHRAGRTVDRHPGIAAGARSGQINLVRRPFGLARSLDREMILEDRKSVVEGKSVSGRVDLGGRSIIKK